MELISPAEAARRLGKHRSTVYRMIAAGKVKTDQIPAEKGVYWDARKGGLVKSKALPKG